MLGAPRERIVRNEFDIRKSSYFLLGTSLLSILWNIPRLLKNNKIVLINVFFKDGVAGTAVTRDISKSEHRLRKHIPGAVYLSTGKGGKTYLPCQFCHHSKLQLIVKQFFQ